MPFAEHDMKRETAQQLIALNNTFYAQAGASFSETRQAPWPGWQRGFDACLQDAGFAARAGLGLRVADIACGNMRYLAFLCEALTRVGAEPLQTYVAVDNCAAMVPDAVVCQSVRIEIRDLLPNHVDEDVSLSGIAEGDGFDLVVCNGFFHHIPGRRMRVAFLRELADLVCDGGMLIISLWRFLENDQLAAKAARATREALEVFAGESDIDSIPIDQTAFSHAICLEDLEENDCFLGWQDARRLFRYCHSFSERDEWELVAAAHEAGLEQLARFTADGRTGDLNAYLVFRARRSQG